jgi:DNA-binding MarR family transcriptional regulator
MVKTTHVADVLWAAHYAKTRSSKRMELDDELTALEHLILELIHDHPAISVAHLSGRLDRQGQSVAVVVRRLAASGLVRATRTASDKRYRELTLTTSGRALVKRSPSALRH